METDLDNINDTNLYDELDQRLTNDDKEVYLRC